jgi:hypothetical protein
MNVEIPHTICSNLDMESGAWYSLACIAALNLCMGCASNHTATSPARFCEVHHCPMTVEDIPCGLAQLSIPYRENVRTNFPHPGGGRAISDYIGYYDILSIKAPVCPKCTKARAQWIP